MYFSTYFPNFYDIFSQMCKKRQLPQIPNKITVNEDINDSFFQNYLTTKLLNCLCSVGILKVLIIGFLKLR